MARTVLELVQIILNDMDSEPVNQLSDTLEAEQVAIVLAETFNDIVSTRGIPEHEQLLKFVPSSDTAYPSEFRYGDNVTRIQKVWYDVQPNPLGSSTNAARQYREVRWCEPLDFLRIIDAVASTGTDFDTVLERSSGTTLRIKNNKFPELYTTFDDKYIIMDSYHGSYETTLTAARVRAYGTVLPTFNKDDPDHEVDLDPAYTQYLLKEATSRCFDLFKGGSLAKLEQSARRAKVHLQNDLYRTSRDPRRPHYGRHN